MKKRSLWIVFLVCLILTVSACSRGQDAQPQETVRIGVFLRNGQDRYDDILSQDVWKYFDDLNARTGSRYELTYADAENDALLQKRQIEKAAEEGIAGMIVIPVDTLPENANVPTVYLDAQNIDREMNEKEATVGHDPSELAARYLTYTMKRKNHADLNEDGVTKILYLTDTDDPFRQKTLEHFRALLEEREEVTDFLFVDAEVWKQITDQTGSLPDGTAEAEVILCDLRETGMIRQYLKDHGIRPSRDSYLFVSDMNRDSIDALPNRETSAIIVPDVDTEASLACDELVGMLQGISPEQRIVSVPYLAYNRNNINEYLH